MIIYKIVNKIDGKIYIGQTVNSLKQRWVHHCGKWSSCVYLRNAIQKHGKDNFFIEEIDRASSLEELNEKEKFWIQFYETTNQLKGYNIRFGGDSSLHSEESKEKMRKSSTGKRHSEETKQKMSRIRTNPSKETREKMSAAQKKRTATEETKAKMREARKRPTFKEEDINTIRISQKRRRYKDLGHDLTNVEDSVILKMVRASDFKKLNISLKEYLETL